MALLCCVLHAARQAIVLHREAESAETFAGGVVALTEIYKVTIPDPVHIPLQGLQRASSAAAGPVKKIKEKCRTHLKMVTLLSLKVPVDVGGGGVPPQLSNYNESK